MAESKESLVAAQNAMFRKHVIDRAELSVKHAEQWVMFFKAHNDPENAEAWENTLKWRLSHLTALTQNDFQDREYRIQNDH